MKKLKLIPVILTINLVVFWIGSLINIEFQTWRYGANFPYPDSIQLMCGKMDLKKVLEITDTSAIIYYISENHNVGTTATFTRQNEDWIYQYWGPIWSSNGMADDFIWPYWYHTVEGWLLFFLFGSPMLLLSILCVLPDRIPKETHDK